MEVKSQEAGCASVRTVSKIGMPTDQSKNCLKISPGRRKKSAGAVVFKKWSHGCIRDAINHPWPRRGVALELRQLLRRDGERLLTEDGERDEAGIDDVVRVGGFRGGQEVDVDDQDEFIWAKLVNEEVQI